MGKKEVVVTESSEILSELRKLASSKDLEPLFAERDAKKAEIERLEQAARNHQQQAAEKDRATEQADAEADGALRSGEDAASTAAKADHLRREAEALRGLAERAQAQIPPLKPELRELNRKLHNALASRLNGENGLHEKLQADLQAAFNAIIERVERQRDEWNQALDAFNSETGAVPPFTREIKVRASYRDLNLLSGAGRPA